MPMTKKEKAHLEHLETQVKRLRALRWSDPTDEELEPDVPAPRPGSGLIGDQTEGWAVDTYTRSAIRAWSKIHRHGYYANTWASQGALDLYSTEAKALRALRRIVEREAAKNLAEIDRKIAEAKARPAPEAEGRPAPDPTTE